MKELLRLDIGTLTQMRRVTITNISSEFTYQSLNAALPSRKCSIKALAKCKHLVYVLMEICLQWSNGLGPSLPWYFNSLWQKPKESFVKYLQGWRNQTQILIYQYFPRWITEKYLNQLFWLWCQKICLNIWKWISPALDNYL